MARKPYASGLTDEQWRLVEPLIPPERPGGRTRAVDVREVLDGIAYLRRSGCVRAWRDVPHDLPNWGACRRYYDRFSAPTARGCRDPRAVAWPGPRGGRTPRGRLAVAAVDAQSVKTTEQGGARVTATRAGA
jgi:putative transposase